MTNKERLIEMIEKFGIFFACFAFIVGAGCALGWTGYHHEWFAFICELVTIAFGVPFLVYLVKRLLK